MLQPRLSVLWAILAVVVSCALVGAMNIVYTNRVAQENNHKWCSLLSTMDDSYARTPPSTPTGKQVAADIRKLREDLSC